MYFLYSAHLADLLVAAGDGIDATRARPRRQIRGEAAERLLLAHRRRRDGVARLARRPRPESVARDLPVLRRAFDDAREVFGQRLHLDLLEFTRDSRQHVAQAIVLQEPDQEIAASHLGFAEQEGGVHPALLDRVGQMLGEVLDGRSSAGQPLQHGLEIAHEPRGVDLAVTQDAVQVGVWEVDDLESPVRAVDVRVAPQLAERHGSLGRLEPQRVALAEAGRTADLSHWSSSLTPPPESSEAAALAPVPK